MWPMFVCVTKKFFLRKLVAQVMCDFSLIMLVCKYSSVSSAVRSFTEAEAEEEEEEDDFHCDMNIS